MNDLNNPPVLFFWFFLVLSGGIIGASVLIFLKHGAGAALPMLFIGMRPLVGAVVSVAVVIACKKNDKQQEQDDVGF